MAKNDSDIDWTSPITLAATLKSKQEDTGTA